MFNNHFNLVRVTVDRRLVPGMRGMRWEQTITKTPGLISVLEMREEKKNSLSNDIDNLDHNNELCHADSTAHNKHLSVLIKIVHN